MDLGYTTCVPFFLDLPTSEGNIIRARFRRPTYLPTDPAAPETRRPTYLPPEGVTVGNGHVTAEFFAARLWRGTGVTAEN